MTPTQYGEVYTVTEVAAIFRVPSDTVRRLIHHGDLPAIRLGRVYRVPKAVIDGLFDLPAQPTTPCLLLNRSYPVIMPPKPMPFK